MSISKCIVRLKDCHNTEHSVEFEMQSDLDGSVGQHVYNSLVSAFGRIDKLKILPIRTYVADLQGNKAFVWKEVSQTS
jgi:hypothetical protein